MRVLALECVVLLQQKRIVITGGSSGIGMELARQAASRKNSVVIVADNPDQLSATAQQLRSGGAMIEALQCDLADPAQVDALAPRLLAAGPVDVLVNNAGYGVYRAFEAEDAAEIDRLLAVNLTAHVRLTKLLVGQMVARRSGSICFMASIAGRLPITPNATYCAAKHGMFGLAQALRYELRRFGIEITTVCPGRIDTPFFDHPTFRARRLGPENRSALSVDRAAAATLRAIETGRAISYVPASLGLAAWLYEALPLLSNPLFSRLMTARIERLYGDAGF